MAVRAAAQKGALFEELTDRELSILRMLPGTASQREIGAALFLSINTVKAYNKSLYRKLDVGEPPGCRPGGATARPHLSDGRPEERAGRQDRGVDQQVLDVGHDRVSVDGRQHPRVVGVLVDRRVLELPDASPVR